MTGSSSNLLVKSRTAFESAQLLLDAGDFDGAANRLYYALFDAARACIGLVDASSGQAGGKTHGSLIAAFGLHMVRNGPFPPEMGRLLNRAFELRQTSDYTDTLLERSDVQPFLEAGRDFLGNVDDFISGARPKR